MALTSRVNYGIMRILDSSMLSSSYQVLGGALEASASLLKIVNNGSTDIFISTDAQIAQDVVPANSFTLYDLTTNAPQGINGIFFPKGTQFYVKGTAGTGSIYLVFLYVTPSAASVAVIA